VLEKKQGCVSAEKHGFFWLAPGESYHPSGILSPDSTNGGAEVGECLCR
jgi:hypothetical protein